MCVAKDELLTLLNHADLRNVRGVGLGLGVGVGVGVGVGLGLGCSTTPF